MPLLSVLDQSPVRSGGTPADAIHESLELAELADRLGYHRYWLAEHHSTPGLGGSSPEVLIGQVAARTSRIRVGAGGVMLQHASALKDAETFRVLETLFPGRIDLGIGRAPGADHLTTLALEDPGGDVPSGRGTERRSGPPPLPPRGPLPIGRGGRGVPVRGARAPYRRAGARTHDRGRPRRGARASARAGRRVWRRRAGDRHDHPRPEGAPPILRAPRARVRTRGGSAVRGPAVVVALAVVGLGASVLSFVARAQPGAEGRVPQLRVDPAWPKPLPNRWLMGQAAGVAVDAQDHVWVLQRPRTLTEEPRSLCCVPAPPVLE